MRRAAQLALAAFFVSAVAHGLRPQLFGMAILAVYLQAVMDRRSHPGRPWANIHGSLFFGPVVLGLPG